MPLTRIFPLGKEAIESYIGSMNMDTSWGKAVPAFDHADMTSSTQVYAWFLNEVLETTAPSGAPRQYAFANKSCYRFDNGTLTVDTTFQVLKDTRMAGLAHPRTKALTQRQICSGGVRMRFLAGGILVAFEASNPPVHRCMESRCVDQPSGLSLYDAESENRENQRGQASQPRICSFPSQTSFDFPEGCVIVVDKLMISCDIWAISNQV